MLRCTILFIKSYLVSAIFSSFFFLYSVGHVHSGERVHLQSLYVHFGYDLLESATLLQSHLGFHLA